MSVRRQIADAHVVRDQEDDVGFGQGVAAGAGGEIVILSLETDLLEQLGLQGLEEFPFDIVDGLCRDQPDQEAREEGKTN